MKDQTPLRILSLDGGGVRGISLLFMLKAIIDEIQLKLIDEFKPLEPIPPIRPCQIFDLICGTSTGGLIAIMFGRLEMTVEEAIHAYKTLSQRVFTSTLKSNTAKFDHHILEQQIKAVIQSSRLNLDADSPLKDSRDGACKMFVIAATLRDGGSATRMRTYTSRTAFAFPGLIWEAARATSAAPIFFEPIVIDGKTFGDGGVGWNNPTEEAIAEARQVWPNRQIGCLVSLGAGLEGAAQLGDETNNLAISLMIKGLPKPSFRVEVAEYFVECLTVCEMTHHRVGESLKRDGIVEAYFRFNVPQGISKIGFEEWEKIGDMITLAKNYMRGDADKSREAVAKLLLEPRFARTKYDFSERIHQESHYFMVPQWCRKNPHFMGREKLLEMLRNKLCNDEHNKFNHRVALFGMGGIGKTQVAIEYVVTYKEKYNSVFWITAVDQPSLILGFQEIAVKTKCVNAAGMDRISVAREVLRWLEKQNSWLLVLDNVDDISVVHDYFPDVHDGHILITTRNRDACGVPAEGLEVEVFESQAAADVLLLRTNLRENGNAQIRSEAARIVSELGFLALAIEQAAAYIRESLKDIFKFLAVYSTNREKLLAYRPRENWAYEYVVATTWLLSFEVLKDRNVYASQLLSLFAFLNPDEILVEFLEVGRAGLPEPLKTLIGNSFELNKALGEMEQLSLIRRPGDGQIVFIHRLVQAVVRDILPYQQKQRYMEMAVALFLCAFPQFEENNRQTCRRYQAQVVGPLLTVVKFDAEDIAKVLLRVGYFLYVVGEYHDGERFELRAVATYTLLFGLEDSRTLTGMNNLASTYGALGRTKESAVLHEKAFEARSRTLGDDHPDTFSSMNNLASTYGYLGRTKEAAALHEMVLEARTRNLGSEHPDTLSSINNLASTYRALGRSTEAIALHEKGLEASMRTLGSEHPNTLSSMNNLAETYRVLGRTKEATALHEKVQAAMRSLGNEHPDTLSSLNNLASTYGDLGRSKEAASLHEKVLEAMMRTLGSEHPNTLSSMNNLASTYRALGRSKEAAVLHEKALEARSRTLGDEHPDTLSSINNLAETYCALGQTNKAAVLHEKALEARSITLGAEHPQTLWSMNNLAETYGALGRTNEAAALHEKTLETRSRTLGDEHPDTLWSMNNLAETYSALGRTIEAAALHEKALQARSRTLGDEHPDMLWSMNNLADTYGALGRTNEAAALHEKALEARITTLGSEHPQTLWSMNNLAETYSALGRSNEAVALHEKALEARESTLGHGHPDTLYIINNLAEMYNALGRTNEAVALHEVVAIHEKVLAPRKRTSSNEHLETWLSMNRFMVAYPSSDWHNEAIERTAFEKNIIDVRAYLSKAIDAIGPEISRDKAKHQNTLDDVDTKNPAETRPTEVELKWWRRVDKYPGDEEFHEELANCYAIRNDPARAIAGWAPLVRNHPTHSVLQSRLSQAYGIYNDQNAAIVGWLCLWETHPTNMGLLKNLRDACNVKYSSSGQSRLSLCYMAWLATFSLLSRWLLEWEIDEVDWWPFVSEDELMMLRPYMAKYQWRCQFTGRSGYDWIHAHSTHFSGPKQLTYGSELAVRKSSFTLGQGDSDTLPAGEVDISDIDPEQEGNSPGITANPAESSTSQQTVKEIAKYVPTFSCFQRTLHHTLVQEENDSNFSDTTTFTELRKTYTDSLGLLGTWRMILSLRSLKKISKIAIQACELRGKHRVVEPPTHSINVLGLQRPPLVDAESVVSVQFKYSSLYVEYLQNPQDCKTKNAFYRKTMPRRDGPLPMTAHPSDCEALVFIHKRYGGIFIILASLTVMGSFIFGAVWSKYKDPALGWTIALSGGAVVVAYMTLMATLYHT